MDENNQEADDELFYDADDQFMEERLNNADNAVPPLSHLQHILRDPETNEKIDVPINVSRAEILLAVLSYSLIYNLPQTAVADLFKMLNCFFLRPILDDTRYMIDKIFYCKDNVEYHCICPSCKQYVKKFDKEIDKKAKCNVCLLEFSLQDPTFTDFFVIMDPDNEIVKSIEKHESYYNKIMDDVANNSLYEFHTGGMYKQFKQSLPENKRNNFATATFNSDGSPVFESSSFSIWPIQMVINELPYSVRSSKPITCGLWFGKQKPNMNIFLDPFVLRMNKLANEGLLCSFTTGVRRLFVYFICCCVDSQARAPMQGIKQYNGYYGCSWCLNPGYYVGHGRKGCVKYILLDEPVDNRTNASMFQHAEESIQQEQSVFGVTHLTVLSNLEQFKLKSGFVPDSMHCIDLGVAGQFLKYWLESSSKPYSFSKNGISKIDSILQNVKVPKNVSRYSRSITDRSYWKAKEWQNWVLYYSMPVLLSFPHLRRYAEHWNLLVRSYFILLNKNIPTEELEKCDKMLKKFVAYTELYYSRSAMTYNVHQLLHLTQSVADWGPLWTHFGYFFENGNGRIVKMIHAAKGVINQICRRIGMINSEFILQHHINENGDSPIIPFITYLEKKDTKSFLKLNGRTYCGPDYPISSKWIRQLNLNLSNSCSIFRKMIQSKCVYTSLRNVAFRSDNSFAITKNGLFIRIKDFIVDPTQMKEFTICHPIRTEDIVFDEENVSSMNRIITVEENLIAIETNTIDRICVQISKDNDNKFISPVPNLFSY